MIFICALVPIANLAVSLAFGGGCAPFSLLLTLVLLPLSKKIKPPLPLLAVLVACSVFFRSASLLCEAVGALGAVRACIIAVGSIVASGIAAYNRKSALYICTPIFFITALLAVYITAVSFGNAEFTAPQSPNTSEILAVAFCLLSSCLSVGCIGNISPSERIKGGVIGSAVCCVLLLFKSASAEFGFISVPLAVSVSAIELSAVISRIQNE